MYRVLRGYAAVAVTGVPTKPCMKKLQRTLKVPSMVLQLAVALMVLHHMRPTYVAGQEESGCIFCTGNLPQKGVEISCGNVLWGAWISNRVAHFIYKVDSLFYAKSHITLHDKQSSCVPSVQCLYVLTSKLSWAVCESSSDGTPFCKMFSYKFLRSWK